MHIRKYTTTLIAAGIASAGAAHADLTLAEGLTVKGFVDMSATYTDLDSGSDTTMSWDQWEIQFDYDFKNGVTARVDIDDNNDGDGVAVEVASITAAFAGDFSFTAGLFLSALGFEGPEPVDLWQYSYSATVIGYPGYSQGAALAYGTDLLWLYGAVLDGSYDSDGDADDVSIEVAAALTPSEDLKFFLGYASQDFDTYEQGIANFYLVYTIGSLSLAAEYNYLMEIGEADNDGSGWILAALWGFAENASVTFRTSGVDLDVTGEHIEYTFSPSYTFNDNLFGLLEFRYDDFDDDALDAFTAAAELVFTF